MSKEYNLNQMLSSREAAEFLGVSTGTLSNWRCNKRVDIPYFKIGGSIKYSKERLLDYLMSQEVTL